MEPVVIEFRTGKRLVRTGKRLDGKPSEALVVACKGAEAPGAGCRGAAREGGADGALTQHGDLVVTRTAGLDRATLDLLRKLRSILDRSWIREVREPLPEIDAVIQALEKRPPFEIAPCRECSGGFVAGVTCGQCRGALYFLRRVG